MRHSLRSRIFLLLASCLAAMAVPVWAQEGSGTDPGREERPSYLAWVRGNAAERAGNLEAALAGYTEALRKEPENPQYNERVRTLRYAVTQSFTNRAERAILGDNLLEAASLLRTALSYDPGNEEARDRLRQLERQAIEETTSLPEYASASPQLVPQPGTRDINYRGDARGAYLDLARQFGLLAVFDEDTTKGQIRFRVSGVDFWTAARLLGEQTGTFFRVVDGRTFLVANDTQQKRREYLPQIERTLLLPESEKPEQMNEMVRAVRDIAGLTHTQLDTRTRSLTVRGAEKDVALATALLRQLEQPRGEVMLEIEVLEVDRNTAENLGIVPPSSAQVVTLSQQQLRTAQASTNGLVQVIEQLFGTPTAFPSASSQQLSTLLATGTTPLSSLVPPLIAFGGGQTVFLATLPGATANFASQISAVRRAQRILLRAQDGEAASFFVGDRFPINLAVLSNSFTSGGNVPAIGFAAVSVGQSPRGMLSASLRTGNTHLDLVTANHGAGTVSVLLGNGDGTFQSHVDYPAGTSPVAVAAAAFRGSGQPSTINSISRSNGTVTATLGSALTVPRGNGVGMVSVAGVSDSSFDGSFVVLTGSGTTTLTWAQAGPNASSSGGSAGANFVDLAVVDQGTDNVLILLGNGDGTFQAPVRYAVGRQPSGIVLADFNGDGHTDIAVTNTSDNTVSVLLGNGDGTFQAATAVALARGQGPVGIVAADFNGDTFTDLAVTNSVTNTVTLLFGDGHGNFSSQTDFSTKTLPVAIAAADFNGDSHEDFVVANQTDGTISVFLNQGGGRFTSRTDLTVGRAPDAVITGDFNNDGRQDIVVANSGDNTLSILFGAGDGTFPATASLPVGRLPAGLASGDFNGDGLTDVATTNEDDSSVTVVINSQHLTAAQPQTPYPGSQYEDIGVKAKATPRIHPSGDVTLNLTFEIRSLRPASFNGIPVISNRTVEQTIRLRQDEPSVLSGIFSDQQSLMVTGWPGAAEAPGLEQVTSNRNPTDQLTELIVVVTPRAVRLAPRITEVLYAGHERQTGIGAGRAVEVEEQETPEPVPQPPLIPPGETPPAGPPQPNLPRPRPQPQPQPQP